MKKTTITTEIINGVYTLYKKGVDRRTIADAQFKEITYLLHRQCKALERLCAAWGV